MAMIRYAWYFAAVLGAVTSVSAAPTDPRDPTTPTVPLPHVTAGYSPRAQHPSCVTGVPAVLPSDGAFPIPWFATVAPTPDGSDIVSHYTVRPSWAKSHGLHGGEDLGGPIVNGYQAMKCQYACTAQPGCVSFLVSVSDTNPTCALFDAIIQPSNFVLDESVKPWGAYNMLCNPPRPWTGLSGKRDAVEKVISSSLLHAADNCTESQVTPGKSWTNYGPNKNFISTHGKDTWTETSTNDGAGFETAHRSCHQLCTGFTWCKSVFLSYVSNVFGCTLFDAALTYDVYVEGTEGGTNTLPFGWNQHCPS